MGPGDTAWQARPDGHVDCASREEMFVMEGGAGEDRLVVTAAEATSERWDDLVAVIGTRGDPPLCWCQ